MPHEASAGAYRDMPFCRFTSLQSINGTSFTAEEVAAAGQLFGGLEAALDAALVRGLCVGLATCFISRGRCCMTAVQVPTGYTARFQL